MHDLFVFRQTGVDDQRRVQGSFEATGIIPNCLARFAASGLDVPRTTFERGGLEFDRVDYVRGL
jgi:pilus assembly protein CpaF